MCGLSGLFYTNPDPVPLRESAVAMAAVMRHRGPDDAGSWVDRSGRVAFGFRRLAIQDRSDAGHQPMTSPSGRYTVVMNGEAYNFARLRAELGPAEYRGGSDTEVLLHAFDAWGIEATLSRLIGMFAFAVWDAPEEELWLVRDRLGIKPLYLARTRDGLAFASELRALLVAPGFDSTLDFSAVGSFLEYLYIPAPATPFLNVRKIEPGHLIRIRRPTTSSEPFPEQEAWWTVAKARREGETVPSAAPESEVRTLDKLEDLLSDAVALRLVADVPVGGLLSGGIDSSLVVALMRRHASGPVRTFTIGFDQAEHDESAPAREVARHLGTDHTELRLSGADALAVVPELSSIFDEPLADPSQVPTYLVSALARHTVTVALSGDGGDELFAGYNRYAMGLDALRRTGMIPRYLRSPAGRALDSVPRRIWRMAERIPQDQGRAHRLLGIKAAKLARFLRAADPPEMYRSLLTTRLDADLILRPTTGCDDPIRKALRALGAHLGLSDLLQVDQRYYLPDDLLQKVDRASMAVALEVRVPILDHRVVEFSWALPDSMKLRGGEGKWALRQILYRHVPEALVDRPKVGFSVPIETWLRGPLRGWAEDLLLGPSPIRDELFEPAEIRARWKRFTQGGDEEALGLWALLMFESWRSRWGIENLSEAKSCEF